MASLSCRNPTLSFGLPEGLEGVKPIAIFTDGFTYHKDIAGLDTLKRMAIAKNGKFRIWSLSWKDVHNVFQNQGDYFRKTLSTEGMPYGSAYAPTVRAYGVDDFNPGAMNSFSLLLEYLANGNSEDRFQKQAFAYSICLCDPTKTNNYEAHKEWTDSVRPLAHELGMDMTYYDETCFFGKWQPRGDACNITFYSALTPADLKAKRLDSAFVLVALEDRQDVRSTAYESDWNGFFYAYNLLQSIPGSAFITLAGIEGDGYSALEALSHGTFDNTEHADRTETLTLLFDETIRTLAQTLADMEIPAPSVVGFELSDEDAGVLGEAELVWESRKIAVLTNEQVRIFGSI